MSCIAYAINRDTGATTRWTDSGFSRLWNLNYKPYLVRADGVYLLDAAATTPVITAEVQLSPMNFGSDQLKRVSYATIEGDGLVEVTPIYDAAVGQTYVEQFTQASRVKFGKGNKSRWMAVKIASADPALRITSINLVPEVLTRKVT